MEIEEFYRILHLCRVLESNRLSIFENKVSVTDNTLQRDTVLDRLQKRVHNKYSFHKAHNQVFSHALQTHIPHTTLFNLLPSLV